jgi:hypothetical protein
MEEMWLLLLVLTLACTSSLGAIPHKNPNETKGIVLLDAITFPKLVPSNSYHTVIFIAHKSQIGDYGTDSMRADYFSVVNDLQLNLLRDKDSETILFTQVIVNGAENAGLAKELGMPAKYRHPMLFVVQQGANGLNEAIEYPSKEPFHAKNIINFIEQHTNSAYRRPGALKKIEKSMINFMSTTSEDEQLGILDEIRSLVTSYQKNQSAMKQDQDDASYYVSVMEKILQSSDEFLSTELDRLEDILENNKLATSTRINIRSRIEILKKFLNAKQKADTIVQHNPVTGGIEL